MKLIPVFYWHSYNILIFLEIASVFLVLAAVDEKEYANQTLLNQSFSSAETIFQSKNTFGYDDLSETFISELDLTSLKGASIATEIKISSNYYNLGHLQFSDDSSLWKEISPQRSFTSSKKHSEFHLNTVSRTFPDSFSDQSDFISSEDSLISQTPLFPSFYISENIETDSSESLLHFNSDKDELFSEDIRSSTVDVSSTLTPSWISPFLSDSEQPVYMNKDSGSQSINHSITEAFRYIETLKVIKSPSDNHYKIINPTTDYVNPNPSLTLEQFDSYFQISNLTFHRKASSEEKNVIETSAVISDSELNNLSDLGRKFVNQTIILPADTENLHLAHPLTLNAVETVNLTNDDSSILLISEVNDYNKSIHVLFEDKSNFSERTGRDMILSEEKNTDNLDLIPSFQISASDELFFPSDFTHGLITSFSLQFHQNIRTSVFNSQQTHHESSHQFRADDISSDFNNFDRHTDNYFTLEHLFEENTLQPIAKLTELNFNNETESLTLEDRLSFYLRSLNEGKENDSVNFNKNMYPSPAVSFNTSIFINLFQNDSEWIQENSRIYLLNSRSIPQPLQDSHNQQPLESFEELPQSSLRVNLKSTLSYMFLETMTVIGQMTNVLPYLSSLSLHSNGTSYFNQNLKGKVSIDSGEVEARTDPLPNTQHNESEMQVLNSNLIYISSSVDNPQLNYSQTLHPTPVQSSFSFQDSNESSELLFEEWTLIPVSSSIEILSGNVSVSSTDISEVTDFQDSTNFKMSSEEPNLLSASSVYPEIPTISTPVNYTKDVRKILKKSQYPLGNLSLSLGKLSRVAIPKDMLEKIGSVEIMLLEGNGQPVPNTYWLQLTSSGDILCLPVHQSYIGIVWKFTLRAVDNKSETIEDNFTISLNSEEVLNRTHEISVKLNCSFLQFTNNIETMSLFLKKLADFLGYNNTDDIVITKIESGSVNVKWTNLRWSKCNPSAIMEQFNKIASPDGTPSRDFVHALGDEFPVISVNSTIDYNCTLEDSIETDNFKVLAVTLPIVGILFGIAIITACCIVNKRYQQKQKIHISNIDVASLYYLKTREPIILKDEVDSCSKNLKPKRAVVLNSDELSDNFEMAGADFFSPPSFHSEEHLHSSQL